MEGKWQTEDTAVKVEGKGEVRGWRLLIKRLY